MYKHEDIWRAIDRLADSAGYSPSGLAKKAGLDPTTFNKSKRVSGGKPRWPSTESIAKILAVTNMTMADFFSLAGIDNKTAANNTAQTIPLLSLAQAGRNGHFDADGRPSGKGWDRIPFPGLDQTDVKSAYALEVSGDTLAPLYRDGTIIVISPETGIRRGDRVIVKTGGQIVIGEITRQTAGRVELNAIAPGLESLALDSAAIDWMARILWASQ